MTDITVTAARKHFFDLFDEVVRKHQRIVVNRRGKDRIALVPLADLQQLQAFEDAADLAAAEGAWVKPSERIAYDEIKKELGL